MQRGFLQDRMSERERKMSGLVVTWFLFFQTSGFWGVGLEHHKRRHSRLQAKALPSERLWVSRLRQGDCRSGEKLGVEKSSSPPSPLARCLTDQDSEPQRIVFLREFALVKGFSDSSWAIYPWEVGNEGKTGGGKMWRSCMLPGLKTSRIWAVVSTQTHLYLQFPEAWEIFSCSRNGVWYPT